MTFKNIIRITVLVAVVFAWACGVGSSAASASNYVLKSRFGASGSEDGQLLKPQGVAVDQATHDVYVADAENHRVEKFSNSGTFVAVWGWGVSDGVAQSEVCTSGCQSGMAGAGEGQFDAPFDIAVDNSGGVSEGNVYVGDRDNDVVEEFDSSGKYLTSFSAGTSGPFASIYGVAVDGTGDLWVYDSDSEVYEFSSNGLELQQWTTNFGAEPGFAVDANDNVYAARGCRCLVKFSSLGTDLGEFDESSDNTTGLSISPLSKNVFSDQGTFVVSYEEPETLPSIPTTTFGEGILADGTGIGVDSSGEEVYVADASSNEIFVFGPPPLEPPKIENVTLTKVLTSSAEFRTRIRTGNVDTKYYIEYGTTPSYGSVSPPAGVDVGSGVDEVISSQIISALSPATTYYYRVVATNSQGTVYWTGAHDEFTTSQAIGQTFRLPDNRSFEMVSPANKNGGDVLSSSSGTSRATLDGNKVVYTSIIGFGGTQSSKISQYLSTRGLTGWSTDPITPPANEGAPLHLEVPYVGVSEDLSSGVLTWPFAELTPEASVGYENLYLRDVQDDTYKLITIGAPAQGNKPELVGASANYSHIVFETEDVLTEGAVPGSPNVYEWFDGRLSLVSVLSGSSAGVAGARGGSNRESGNGNTQNAVSSDGRLVFWHDEAGQLYVRENGAETIKVNASKRKVSLGDGSATFEGATPDGKEVFFSDTTALTEAPDDNGGLYEFDTASGELRDMTPNLAGSPELQGIVGFSKDGSYVYFVADGRLETAPALGGRSAVAGEPNLYVAHGGQVVFIATLGSGDSNDWAQEPTNRNATVTSDGLHLAFMSSESLTGYDNLDASGGASDTEVFEYDFDGGQLGCVSCDPTGAVPIGSSSIPTWSASNYSSFYLSNSGDRLFFDSNDMLSAHDTNGEQDVYEWERDGVGSCAQERGCIYLISTGTSGHPSTFLAASEDGSNVFLTTRSQLVPQDPDENIDVYDARVDGGFPVEPTTAPCAGDSCQGILSAAPEAVMPLTAFLSPSEGESKQPIAHIASFALAPIGRRALKRFVKTGHLELDVSVSEIGTVRAKATATSGRRITAIASDATSATGAGKVHLSLVLTRFGRRRLATGHKLDVTITVRYSRVNRPKRVRVVLQGSRSAG